MEKAATKKELYENIVSAVVVIGILVAGLFFVDLHTIRDYIEQAGFWAPLIFILIKASALVFAPVSGTPLYLFAAPLFGPWEGFVLLVLGDMLGGVVSFWISRIFGQRLVKRLVAGHFRFIEEVLDSVGTVKGFFLIRVSFIALPEAASYAAGLTKLPFPIFFLIQNLVGLLPIAGLVFFGDLVTRYFDTAGILIAVVGGFVMTFAGGFLYLKYHNKEREKAL